MGMLFMYLSAEHQHSTLGFGRHIDDTYRLKNQGSDATDNCTSTSWKWSWMIGKHRATSASNTRWSRRVPCIDGLWGAVKPERESSECDHRTYNIQATDDRRSLPISRMLALLTCNYNGVRKHVKTRRENRTSESQPLGCSSPDTN